MHIHLADGRRGKYTLRGLDREARQAFKQMSTWMSQGNLLAVKVLPVSSKPVQNTENNAGSIPV